MIHESQAGSDREERLEAILHAYLEAQDKGITPDAKQIVAENPDLAEELAAFFADQEKLDHLARAAQSGIHRLNPAEAPTLAPAAPLAAGVGKTIRYFGDYELLEEIARGGMGVVYKARQVSLNRTVALKMILAGQLAGEQDVRRFQMEAQTAANLQHPNIVAIHEVGEHDGQYYFSMDYIEGQSLADRVREHPLPPHDAVRYLSGIALAVQYAHANGTLHRDLKPSNVLIDRFDQPRVTDFGLAKRIDGEKALTLSGAVVGTPSYMPPEQAGGKSELLGPASDVYSMGAVLYELVTGRPPFRAATAMDTLLQVLNEEPAAPRLLNPSINRDLETILLKCLGKEPARRYATAQALADDLRRWSAGEAIHARRPGVLERSARWARKHRQTIAIAAAAAAVAVGLVLGGAYAFQSWQQWRQGSLFIGTNGPVLTAELLTEEGEPASPHFTVPNEEPIRLPTGNYRLRVWGQGFQDETFQVHIEQGKERSFDVNLEAQRLGEPIAVSQTSELVHLDGRDDVLLLTDRGLSRVHAKTGQTLWSVSLEAKDQPLLAGFSWKWEIGGWPSGRGEHDRRPRLLRPAVDLDGDGTPDLVWCSRRQAALLALSGKTGKVLWCFQASLPQKIKDEAFYRERASQGTVIGIPAVIDVNGDGTGDLIVTMAAQELADGTKPRWVEAVDGRTGKSLWRHDLDVRYFAASGGDALPSESRWNNLQGVAMYSQSRFSMGQRLYDMDWSEPQGIAVPHAAQVVMVEGGPLAIVVAGTFLIALDLATGRPAWPAVDLGFWPLRPPQFADLNGAGLQAALLLGQQSGSENEQRLYLAAISLQTRKLLWQVPFRGYYAWNWFQQPFDWPVVADLEGDGKAEIILPAGDRDGHGKWSGLQVLEGATGERRWLRRLTRSGWAGEVQQVNRFLVGPDLNGDGHREIFTCVVDGEPFPPDKPYSSIRIANLDKDYSRPLLLLDALSGKDGHSLWWARQRIRDGSSLTHYPKPSVGTPRWWKAGPDGWPQLVVPFVPGSAQGEQRPRANYLVSAGTGKILHVTGDFPEVQVGDLDGDGVPDLVGYRPNWSDAFDHGGDLEVLRGRSPEIWQRLEGDWQVAADLDGDGIPDLIPAGPQRAEEKQFRKIKERGKKDPAPRARPQGQEKESKDKEPDGAATNRLTTALSGSDGHILWQTALTADKPLAPWQSSTYQRLQPLPAGADLDGDGVPDLLASWYSNHSTTNPESPLIAVSGKTGKRIWAAGLKIPYWSGPQLLECRDLLGNGTPDVLFVASMMDLDQPPSTTWSSQDAQSWLVVLSGRDGTVRWKQRLSEPNQGRQSNDAVSCAFADLDGDGVQDVAIEGGHVNQCQLAAFSGRDGRQLWQWHGPAAEQEGKPGREGILTLAVGDLLGDGRTEIVVLVPIARTDPKGMRRLYAQVTTLDARTGQSKWTWEQPVDWQYNGGHGAAARSVVTPLLVNLDGGKQRAICVCTYSHKEQGNIFLLDPQGHEIQHRPTAFRLNGEWQEHQRRSPNLFYDPWMGTLFKVWAHDLEGDGKDELIVFTRDKLRVTRGGLENVLWEMQLPDEDCDLLQIFPAAGKQPATLAVRIGSRVLGLAGPDGKPRWSCTGPGTVVSLLPNRQPAVLPRVLYDMGNQVSACRQTMPVAPDGTLPVTTGFEPFTEKSEDDPRLVIPLPWAAVEVAPPLFPHTLFAIWWTACVLALAVVVFPFLSLRWALRRRWWLWLLPVLWLGLVGSFVYLLYRLILNLDAGYQISEKGEAGFVLYVAAWLVGMSVASMPAVVFLAVVWRGLRQRHWLLLAGLVLLTAALAAGAAALWLHSAPLDEEQRYSLGGWYGIAPAGAYLVGVLFLAWSMLLRLVRGVRWAARRLFRKASVSVQGATFS
jgi:outer membrane protein assembly factor BamB/tRNA A-37 threonylcarbamoyl transferase component Bud32